MKLPLDDPEFLEAMQRAAEGINGFVYQGDRLAAVIDTIAWLRDPANSAVTAVLLDPQRR